MNGHQLASPFTWKEGDPHQRGHDWKITVKGINGETHYFHVHLQVVASQSLYFSKFYLDEEERYKETNQKEVEKF